MNIIVIVVFTDCNVDMDVVVAIDASTSVGEDNFRRAVDFVDHVAGSFVFSGGQTRLSVLTYNDRTRVWFDLDKFSRKSDMHATLQGMYTQGGPTYLAQVIKKIREEVFNPKYGDRPLVPNKCIFIVDGVSNVMPSETKDEAEQLHQAGIEVYIIAVGISVMWLRILIDH